MVRHLPGVEDVLVDAVEGEEDGGEGVEEGVGHPDAEGRVFLSQQLAAADAVAVTASDEASGAELNDAEKQRESAEPGDVVPVAFAMDEDEVDGLSEGEQQGRRPEVEACYVDAPYDGIGFGPPELQRQGDEEGQRQRGTYLGEHEQHAFPEPHLGMVAYEGEDDGRHHGDHEVAHDGVGGDGGAVGTEQTADDGHRRRHGAEHSDKHPFGHHFVAEEQLDKQVAAGAHHHLEEHEPQVEGTELEAPQVDGCEGEQQDGEDDEGHRRSKECAPTVEQ